MSVLEPIEGETPIDISDLRVKGIATRAQLNPLEFANVTKAISKHLARRPTQRSAPFDVPWARRVHRDMLGDVWKWAGRFRQLETNIGVPWPRIEVELTQALEDLRHQEQNGDFFDQAVRLHHRAVSIHPFPNGNGRWSRLLANIWLRLHDEPAVLWPVTIGEISPVRAEYLAAIKAADAGNLEPLTELHRRFSTRG